MICLDNTDTLEGGASVTNVVDYTVHGLSGTTFANLKEGQLSDTDPSVLYTATAGISIVSVVFVNTHSSAVTVNLYLDPANAGTPRRLIPKNLSLGVGYSMHFDGQRCTVLDTSGNIQSVSNASAVAHGGTGLSTITDHSVMVGSGTDPVTPIAVGTTGQVLTGSTGADPAWSATPTVTSITLTGGKVAFPAVQQASADPNTNDDYEEGTWDITITCATSGTVTVDAAYTTQAYVKNGREVHVQGFVRVSAINSPVGDLFFSLPITSDSLDDLAGASEGVCATDNLNFTGNYLTIYVAEASTIFRVREITDAGASDYIDGADIAVGDYFHFQLNYRASS